MSFDLNSLIDFQSEDWYYSIEKVNENFSTIEIKLFYNLLPIIFKNQNVNIIDETIKALCRTLKNQDNIKLFAKASYIKFIPFDMTNSYDEIFEIFYRIADIEPNCFYNIFLYHKLLQLIEFYPHQILSIIATYALHFEEVSDPWAILDILFRKSKSFYSSECAQDYLSLLVFLNKFSEFREVRSQHTWNCICEMLITNETSVLISCYNSLNYLASVCPQEDIYQWVYPIIPIISHLAYEPSEALQDSIFAFFVRLRPSGTRIQLIKLIHYILICAHENLKANLILLWLSENLLFSQIMLVDSNWLCDNLPTLRDTLKLVSQILLHEENQSEILLKPQIFTLFNHLISSESSQYLNPMSLILLKLPLTEEFVQEMSKNKNLHNFFFKLLKYGDQKNLKNAIQILSKIMNFSYVREMSEMVRPLVYIISKNNSELSLNAAKVTIELCKFPLFLESIKKTELNEQLEHHKNEPDWNQLFETYLSFLT